MEPFRRQTLEIARVGKELGKFERALGAATVGFQIDMFSSRIGFRANAALHMIAQHEFLGARR